MNNGVICVSVCAENADEFIGNTRRAEMLADIVELRFDCLKKGELANALEKTCSQKNKKTLILTYRPPEQGGKNPLTIKEREFFWCSGYDFCAHWADVEPDLYETVAQWLFEKIICSYHDFEGVPSNLIEIYEKLKATGADILKIAVHADEISETIAVWKLLERATAENVKIIPIAMGEAGKWTRILGLAQGAILTYAALESGKETASGQISVADLLETYRVKELNRETDIYGIIGNPVSHSLSPYIHNAAFKYHNLNAVYVPFEVGNLEEFIAKFINAKTREINLNFKGFSVTAPHKQAIIPFLDSIDKAAEIIGAVNTVKIIDGKLHGYNTDAEGFIEPLKNAYGNLQSVKVAVLGNGGAARAIIYALKQNGAEITVFARNIEKARLLTEQFDVKLEELSANQPALQNSQIIVNTTTLGSKGAWQNETPVTAEQMSGAQIVYDLIYNPFETRFMNEAKIAGVPTVGGMAMLIGQAMAQFTIWTKLDAPMKEMSRAALQKLK